ncbi:MAG: hypothetical protein CFE21_14370 [Bacteroidetes bacterium B1(2017)]|nr:MAG: hypothetical protein CFE21_14370 [Bacteroidetes bacterium B1(2017)]
MNESKSNSPWLGFKGLEIAFILLPALICCLSIFIFKDYFQTHTEVNAIWWLLLVVGIDVSHVYSTLFRTYFNSEAFNKNRDLFTYTPIICLVVSILLYAIHPMAFWRVLAYLAVFHFMRQQYGIMRLYERNENLSNLSKQINSLTIYSAVLYPILFWHVDANRQFSWFVEGDFLAFASPFLKQILGILYGIVLLMYVVNTGYTSLKNKSFNVPKHTWIMGTILSWYLGIVAFNADLIFSALNILTHGIPYIALIWIYGKKQAIKQANTGFLNKLFSLQGVLGFIIILLAFSYIEEGLWDGLIWRDHELWFKWFTNLPHLSDPILLSILVPVLSLPQITHYVLDAYIWKVKQPQTMPHLL